MNDVLHYVVDWHPTIMVGHSLGHAKELVDKFEATSSTMSGQARAKELGAGRGFLQLVFTKVSRPSLALIPKDWRTGSAGVKGFGISKSGVEKA